MQESVSTDPRVSAFFAYVRGDAAEPDLLSAVRHVSRGERHRIFKANFGALSAIDPARSVILESIL